MAHYAPRNGARIGHAGRTTAHAVERSGAASPYFT
jgi:hypothetical protein